MNMPIAAWRRIGALAVLILAVAGTVTLFGAAIRRASRGSATAVTPAETLVASIRAEPRSFNRYTARDLSTTVLTHLMHAGLVRIDRVTNQLEPELAESWELLADRQTYRLRLRQDVRFSDGSPFSADDVVFSFRAIYDERAASVLADTLQVRGQPLTVAAEDPATVTVRFPSPFAPGLRMLDGVPIYPRHRLESALNAGTFRSAWGVATPLSQLTGLGPFTLMRYEPGQRLVFDRNPHYWQRSRGLPKLSRLILEVVPDQDAELLQLATGTIDLTQSELRPSDLGALKPTASPRVVSATDAGIGLDGDLLWLNLAAAKASDPRSAWLQHRDFRRAIARSVDRTGFVDTVYLGAAVPADSIVSPGNRDWHAAAPPPAYDITAATQLLASLDLRHRRGDDTLEDRLGREVRFTLLTQKGNTSLERGAAVIRDSLAPLGVRVDVVAIEVGALIDYIRRGDYDAAYFRLLTTDPDPALNLDFWLSSGSAHMWNPEQRITATRWEAEMDQLMNEISTTLDIERRRRLFARVQGIVAEQVPVLCFAFPRVSIAISTRVGGAAPVPFRPPVLWKPEAISVVGAGRP
jgi:peptide/nickel transport system substrate-binding protein